GADGVGELDALAVRAAGRYVAVRSPSLRPRDAGRLLDGLGICHGPVRRLDDGAPGKALWKPFGRIGKPSRSSLFRAADALQSGERAASGGLERHRSVGAVRLRPRVDRGAGGTD